ncbi:MAG: hypothetical protein GY936_14210 [Ignavibacteriae bacterium]|nr:hypothetical protein [Ignavibacteriota bacterium]
MGLDTVELIVEIESEFEVEITDVEAEKLVTIGDCIVLLNQRVQLEQGEKEIFKRLTKLVSETSGVDVDKITKETNIVQDLKLD